MRAMAALIIALLNPTGLAYEREMALQDSLTDAMLDQLQRNQQNQFVSTVPPPLPR
jgi:hypothetical protein